MNAGAVSRKVLLATLVVTAVGIAFCSQAQGR
jgi:hypothetical protein